MNRLFSQFLRILVYSNVLIALSAGIFSLGWTNTNNIANWTDYGLFSFFATLTIYNLDKLWKIQWVKQPSEWLMWIQTHYIKIWIITFSSAILGIYFLNKVIDLTIFSGISTILIGAICAVFYSFPIKKFRIRNVPGVKALLIAFVWVLVIGLFPLMNTHQFSLESIYTFLFLFPFFLALTIPFDIRDAEKDEIHLKTIPQVMGAKFSKLFALSLLVSSFLFAIFIFNVRILVFLLPVYGLCTWLIFQTNKQSQWWHFALIDLCILFLGLVQMVFVDS